MNFSRVKLVIIICLAVFNIVLGAFCIRLVYDNSYISEEETELAEKHLSKNGIKVEFNNNLRKKRTLPIYSVSVSSDGEVPEIYKNITDAFFGVSVNSEDYVTIPGGYSVSVKDKNGVSLGASSLDDNMILECARENILTDADTLEISLMYYSSKAQMSENKGAEKIAEKFVKKALGNSELEYVKKGSSAYKDGHIVYFVGSFSGTEVLDLYLNVFVKGEEPLYCVGSIIDNIPQKNYGTELIDSVNILYYLIDEAKSEEADFSKEIRVTDMAMTYKMLEYEMSEYYMIPTWLIKYNDGQGYDEIVAIDAIVAETRDTLKVK